jgi:hypothetical protein
MDKREIVSGMLSCDWEGIAFGECFEGSGEIVRVTCSTEGFFAQVMVEVNGLPFAGGFVEAQEFATAFDYAETVGAGVDFAKVAITTGGHSPGGGDCGDGTVFMFEQEEGDIVNIEVKEFGLHS